MLNTNKPLLPFTISGSFQLAVQDVFGTSFMFVQFTPCVPELEHLGFQYRSSIILCIFVTGKLLIKRGVLQVLKGFELLDTTDVTRILEKYYTACVENGTVGKPIVSSRFLRITYLNMMTLPRIN